MEKLRQQYSNILFPILFIALPLSKAVASVSEVALLVLSLLFFYREFTWLNIRRYAPVLIIGLLFFNYLLGLLWSTDILSGLHFLNMQHSLLLMPLIVFLNREKIAANWGFYLRCFVWSSAAAGVITLLLNFLPENLTRNIISSTGIFNEYSSNSDPEAFGLYCPIHNKIQFTNIMCLATIMGLYSFVKTRRKLLIIALLIIIVNVLLIGGRGGQLGLLAGLLVWMGAAVFQQLMPRLTKATGKIGAVAILLSVVMLSTIIVPYTLYETVPAVNKRYHQLFWEMETINDGSYKDYDYSHFTSLRRLVSWQNMWTVIKQNPILGAGTGDHEQKLKEAYANDGFNLPVNNHSQYLQIWASIGIIGLLVFFGTVLYWLIRLRNHTSAYHLALAFMVFYLVCMIPDAILLRQVDNMCFPLFMGIIACINLKEKPTHA
jgi:O-antigen ligase